jgi:hypothetical protein
MKDFPAVNVKPDANVVRFLTVHAHQDAATVNGAGNQFSVTSLNRNLDSADDLNPVAWINRIIGEQHPELLTVNVDQQTPAVELIRAASARLPRQAD